MRYEGSVELEKAQVCTCVDGVLVVHAELNLVDGVLVVPKHRPLFFMASVRADVKFFLRAAEQTDAGPVPRRGDVDHQELAGAAEAAYLSRSSHGIAEQVVSTKLCEQRLKI